MAFTSPRIKICGITRPEDAVRVLDLGVDAIGLVFYRKSPRTVAPAQARQIARLAGPFVSVTGLFVNASAEEVQAVLREVPLQVLQFHGDEPADFCRQFDRPWIKALRVRADLDVAEAVGYYADASAILFDTYRAGVPGGTGEVFDWKRIAPDRLPPGCSVPVVLAGGLNPENVADAIRCVQPYAVDVSGGVESEPGRKDPHKLKRFVEAVRNCN